MLQLQRGPLLSTVAQAILKAQEKVGQGTITAAELMRLAENTRALGKIEGQIDACAPVPADLETLRAQRKAIYKDLVIRELLLNELWADRSFVKWFAARTSLQNYHRVIARLDTWIAKAAAAQTGRQLPVMSWTNPATTSSTGTVPTEPAMFVEEADFVETSEATPIYRRGWFWAGLGVVAVGLGALALR